MASLYHGTLHLCQPLRLSEVNSRLWFLLLLCGLAFVDSSSHSVFPIKTGDDVISFCNDGDPICSWGLDGNHLDPSAHEACTLQKTSSSAYQADALPFRTSTDTTDGSIQEAAQFFADRV